ncbi:hypothetical protein EXIGLDRAFT_55578 [Exidia glandulosa HHB12029]|uniref:Uncharacterized protein n=1 Tax=Exidia glandulosa HHB12029 TaxID=1314781 RepID=A0A165I8Q4_EXIGL|nr:hypothetical protein EXIGLDRAFT_55578 [Exidia glandulosa HHB12029]
MELFYSSYTAQQLYHQHLVISWMEELVHECQSSPGFRSHFLPDFIRMRVVANGPDWVLRVLKTPQQWKTLTPVVGIVGNDPAGWKSDMQYFFVMTGLPPGITPIVAASAEPDLQCWKCTARPGARLWNQENWGYLPLNLRLDESFAHWLPGSLNANRYEQSLLFHYLGIADPNAPRHTDLLAKKRTAVEYLKPAALMTMPRMMQALCDLDPRPQNARDADSVPVGPDEFGGVTSKSLLCQECLAKMVMARLWVWWQREKDEKSKTELDKGNCWFGYECILQGFKADHASRLNVCRHCAASCFTVLT